MTATDWKNKIRRVDECLKVAEWNPSKESTWSIGVQNVSNSALGKIMQKSNGFPNTEFPCSDVTIAFIAKVKRI